MLVSKMEELSREETRPRRVRRSGRVRRMGRERREWRRGEGEMGSTGAALAGSRRSGCDEEDPGCADASRSGSDAFVCCESAMLW